MPAKQAKLVQIKVTVGTDVNVQNLISQLHTYVGKSKMQDRIEIHVNGVHTPLSSPSDTLDGSDLL